MVARWRCCCLPIGDGRGGNMQILIGFVAGIAAAFGLIAVLFDEVWEQWYP
jgi:hypothetical protein